MWKEFKDFINRGNTVDLAIAVVLGAAFTAIVNSLVNDLIMPLIGMILGGVDFSSLAFTVGDASFNYGNFIQAVLNFLIVALVLFFIIKAMNTMWEKQEAVKPLPEPTNEERLLAEIRDLLKANQTN